MTFRLKSVAIALILAMTACIQSDIVDLCRISSGGRTYDERIVVIDDIILVDGHGDPFLVPDKSCSQFRYFNVNSDGLTQYDKMEFTKVLHQLNTTAINERRAGIHGLFEVRVRSVDNDTSILELQSTRNVKIVSAAQKQKSLDAQLPELR